MRRRDFIALGSAAAAWSIEARAQQLALPVVGFLGSDSPELYTNRLRAFRRGLKDAGYIESENVAIEYRWANGDNNLLPALAAELVSLRAAVNDTRSPRAQSGHRVNPDCFLYRRRSNCTRTCRKLEPTRRQHHRHYSTDFRSWKKMAAALA